jgi:hypothetical protein
MYENNELDAPSAFSAKQPTAAETSPDQTCGGRGPCPILRGEAGVHRLPGARSCPLFETGACSPADSSDPGSGERAHEPIGWIDL